MPVFKNNRLRPWFCVEPAFRFYYRLASHLCLRFNIALTSSSNKESTFKPANTKHFIMGRFIRKYTSKKILWFIWYSYLFFEMLNEVLAIWLSTLGRMLSIEWEKNDWNMIWARKSSQLRLGSGRKVLSGRRRSKSMGRGLIWIISISLWRYSFKGLVWGNAMEMRRARLSRFGPGDFLRSFINLRAERCNFWSEPP